MNREEAARGLKELKKEENTETMMDGFDRIMDELLTDTNVQLSVFMPEGDQEPEVVDNIGAGPVVQFYILEKALAVTLVEFGDLLDMVDVEGFVDGTLELVKEEVMERVKEQ